MKQSFLKHGYCRTNVQGESHGVTMSKICDTKLETTDIQVTSAMTPTPFGSTLNKYVETLVKLNDEY